MRTRYGMKTIVKIGTEGTQGTDAYDEVGKFNGSDVHQHAATPHALHVDRH